VSLMTAVSLDSTTAVQTLDPLDRRLIDELRRQPRASVIDLATRLETSRSALQARIGRLFDSGTVRVVGFADPGLLGRPVVAILKLTVSSPPDVLARDLIAMPAVAWVSTTSAVTTILAQVAFADNQQLAEFVDSTVRSIPAVERVVVDIVISVFNPNTDTDGPNPAWVTRPQPFPETDPIDIAIIEQLRVDGRTPFVKLGEVSSLSTPAARQRTLRLLADGRVRLRTLVDPAAIGLHARGEVHLTVQRDAAGIAQRIASMPNADYVVQTFGSRDIYADFRCRTLAELLAARGNVAALDGVLEIDFYKHDVAITKSPVWSSAND
jgi:DNA-binding Lrp family transcriptional regulator